MSFQRNLEFLLYSDEFKHQMRFVAGPRQTGKTTLIQTFLKSISQEIHYVNWDFCSTRIQYQQNELFYADILNKVDKPDQIWLAFDEIHKYPKWKDILKEAYDRFGKEIHFVVTGSARLDLFRKSGDSLAGRYFLFHLFPLTLSEVSGIPPVFQDESASAVDLIEKRLAKIDFKTTSLQSLLKFSGFPDPLVAATDRYHTKWRNSYIDKLIYEDITQIAHVKELENIAKLLLLLPERIGSNLSINSLAQDMLVSYTAVSNYLYLLELCYVLFKIEPYSTHISRSIKKEKKYYFFDWTHCKKIDQIFENYVALELKTFIEMQNDSGLDFELCYIRTKEGKETDFIILKNKMPFLLIEVKLKKQSIESHHYKNAKILGGIPIVQIVLEEQIAEKYENGTAYQISASRFF